MPINDTTGNGRDRSPDNPAVGNARERSLPRPTVTKSLCFNAETDQELLDWCLLRREPFSHFIINLLYREMEREKKGTARSAPTLAEIRAVIRQELTAFSPAASSPLPSGEGQGVRAEDIQLSTYLDNLFQ